MEDKFLLERWALYGVPWMFTEMNFRGLRSCQKQPHSSVPRRAVLKFISSVSVGTCSLCQTKREGGDFCGNVGNLFAITGKSCCRCSTQWLFPCYLQSYTQCPFALGASWRQILHPYSRLNCPVNSLNGNSTVSLVASLTLCR